MRKNRTISRTDGGVASVKTLTFAYNDHDQIESITYADGQIQYAYDTNDNLIKVAYEDGAFKKYHNFVYHLSGTSNENGVRYANLDICRKYGISDNSFYH